MANNNILKKSIAFLLLVSMNLNTFAANVVLDPNANQNTSLDTSANGVPIINIATPNNRGISMNEFLQYNVGNEGQVLNNADNVGRSHLAGLINSNPNLGPHQAAGLIILQVNGANRSDIEGYIEALSREKVNVILSNENGININGGGTINIKNFTPTTGKVVLNNGDYVGIDVNRGHVVIGSNGFDASTTDYVDLISKTLELQGNLVGNDVRTVQGSNYVDKDGNITANSSGTPVAVAIDGSQLGGMYANRIKIIATDKGAGVNNNAFVVSKNSKLEITADGKIHVNKVQGQGIEITGTEYNQKDMAYSDKGITVNAGTIKLDGTGTQAVEDINLNGNVTNSTVVYTTGSLNTKNLTTSGDVQATNRVNVAGNLDNSGKIQTSGKVDVSGNGTNSGLVQAVDKITIGGNVTNSGDILTNEDFTTKNTTSSGNINAKNITIGNLTNTGKVQSTGNLSSGNIDNTGDILVSGKIQGQNLKNDGKVLANETIAVKDVQNTKTIQAVKSISAEKVDNTGEISTNEDFTAKDTTSSGTINARNLTVGELKNDGKIQTSGNLSSKNIDNTGDVLVSGKIQGQNLKNDGKVLANETVSVSDVTNTGKIVAGKNITTGKVKNDGTLASNEDITVTGSLENSKIVEGKNITVTGNDLKNSGKISVDNIKATVINTDNSGKILSVNDIDLNTKNLTNSGEVLAGNDIKADNTNLNNGGKIASNNNISIKNSAINNGTTGEILSDKIDMSSAISFTNTGKISAGETKLTTNGNLNLVGSLHGQRKLEIEANNIENNGQTTSTGLISIKSNDFKNNKELSADTILIDAKGNVENNDMITGNQAQIKAKNIVNNDLIATENNLILEAQNKITNTTGSTIYGGKVSLKAVDILNEKNSELLGGDLIRFDVTNLKNNVGTIQSSGNILINASKVENIGEVSNLDQYEKYYVTWDGLKLSESEAKEWEYYIDPGAKIARHSDDSKNAMRAWLRIMVAQPKIDGYNSLIFSKYPNLGFNFYNTVGKEGDTTYKTESPEVPDWSLKGKLKSNATTEYGKILASNNIEINAVDVTNKDSVISGGGDVTINSTNFENSVTTGNVVQLKDG